MKSYSVSHIATGLVLMLTAAVLSGAQTKLKPARPAGSSNVWTKEVTIPNTKPKTGRVRVQPRPRKSPLLTLEWRVLKRADDGNGFEVNPGGVFQSQDLWRLAIKPNQPGYLYVIHQTGDEDGQIVFPNSRIDNGRNYVAPNKEYLIPAYCPESREHPYDCWWEMDDQPGREILTLIFSRDMITSLPNEAVGAGGVVKRAVLEEVKRNSIGARFIKRTSKPGLDPKQGGGAGRYVTWVTNTNIRDNDELIETVVLNHRPRE
ncbi:MAG TPA: DUF4384 domain-containing protein [Blastocatellia bacterium]|nr:DUF4384 domain-containing protein [Blastocatellia bacterium]